MDLVNASMNRATNLEDMATVDELLTKLEQRVNEVEQFYSNATTKQPSTSRNTSKVKEKEKEKEKHVLSMKKLQQDASRREAAAAKRMQDLMRQFGSVFRQITGLQKLAWPFMHPVDVAGLALNDYYKIIDRPMDFSTIKNQMETNDGTGYKHVREICADVRLVFKNAMKYNDGKSEVHKKAVRLLEIFEEKWLKFLPKVIEEEERREQEEAEAKANTQLALEASHAKLAREISTELYDIDMHIDELREMVVKQCRNITIMEKRKLGVALANLSPEDLNKALEIVAQGNLDFQANDEEVELDINAQSESTLWRLKFFVKDILKEQPGGSSKDANNNISSPNAADNDHNVISKHKRETCDALAKTAKNSITSPTGGSSKDANKNTTSPKAADKDHNIISKRKRGSCDALAKTAKNNITSPNSSDSDHNIIYKRKR
ncbi:transcription factor GTE6-like isoform X2 [Salvia splendens]|uniref:transcription factor GTE6-like isoform X2 n=1 Tax=Salvia splendens TaxID=180675 RepID=UPI001C277200|nr:transcription factor GTE6-like isoform X2 [Salvia splendens]